jgi:hypothetical protein
MSVSSCKLTAKQKKQEAKATATRNSENAREQVYAGASLL